MAPRLKPSEKTRRRLERQFDALGRMMPALRGTIRSVTRGRLAYVRLPLGLLFVAGGFLSFLPVLGIWMLPLGLMILALDVPPLRPFTTSSSIRLRRRAAMWRRRRAAKRALRRR